MRKGEFEVLFEELLDVWALDVFGLLNLNNLEDLLAESVNISSFSQRQSKTYVDRPETGTMSGSHILVQSLNSIGS